MTDKEKIELKDGVISIFKRFNILDHTATIGGLRDDILRYIDSLQEEPVSEELEEAAEYYATHFDIKKPESFEPYIARDEMDAFKAGAIWQKEHVWHNISEEPCESEFVIMHDTNGGYTSPPSRWPFKNDFNGFLYAMNCKYGANYNKWTYMKDILPNNED